LLIDTHCHLNLDLFENDLCDVIIRARNAGVNKLIVPGIDLETSERAIQISDQFSEVHAAIGIHPNSLHEYNHGDIDKIRRLAQHPKVISIGEIGLDYFRNRAAKELQISAFVAQLNLARELNLPVILHSRESLEDMKQILFDWLSKDKVSTTGVMHSFEGKCEDALQFTQVGFMVSVNGSITFKNAGEKHSLARNIPLDSLLLETDAPFITPVPFRGKRNEPAYLKLIAQRVAELRKCTIEDIVNKTSANALKIWNLDPIK
jgi:TatD DNase family protein